MEYPADLLSFPFSVRIHAPNIMILVENMDSDSLGKDGNAKAFLITRVEMYMTCML